MCGGHAPKPPKEQRRLLETQRKIAEEEWALKSPILQMFGRWARGKGTPRMYIPDFDRLIKEAQEDYEQRIAKAGELASGLTTAVEKAYEPLRGAIERYYGPAYSAATIEAVEREAARAKEETIGIRGLPTNISRRLDEIETWRGGSRVEIERTAALAKGAAMISLEEQLGTERANIEKALTDYEMRSMDELSAYVRAISEQKATFVPSFRLAAAELVAGMPVEQVYANLSNQYAQMYQLQLKRWGAQQEVRIAWVNAFANLAEGIGELIGGMKLGGGGTQQATTPIVMNI